MPRKTTERARKQREGEVMSELCRDHGYTFIANRPGHRVTMMLSRDVGRVVPMYTMQLVVPMDSALGEQMREQYPPGGREARGPGQGPGRAPTQVGPTTPAGRGGSARRRAR